MSETQYWRNGPADSEQASASSEPAAANPQMAEALEEYTAALEAGQRPDRTQFLERYPDVAGLLADYLDGLEFLHRTAAQMRPDSEKRSAALLPGEACSFGDFRILREVGRGGMGIVYEAVQRSLHRRVALKVLSLGAALDSRHRQRFQNEAQAAAQLQHPNIVPVFAFGCEQGVYYYSMRFIEGETLGQFIQKVRQGDDAEASSSTACTDEKTVPFIVGAAPSVAVESGEPSSFPPEPVQEPSPQRGPSYFRMAAWLGVQAAEALEHAHQMGVVHRDVKPANLLLDRERRLWVTDFGLARWRSDADLTATGDLLGTLRYMSPEQASARRGLVDHRTDVYALGATLYELLALQPAFPGDDQAELFRRILHDDPPPLRRLRPGVPRDLETIVLKSLNKRVEDRYATAQEQADDLRRFLEGRPIRARRPGWTERVGKWARRHRLLVAAAAVFLALTMLGLVASTIAINGERRRAEAAYEQEAQARKARDEAFRMKEEALHQERQARAQAEHDYQRAERNFEQARRIVDYIAEVAAVDMAAESDAANVRRKLLQAARRYYQEFLKQASEDRLTREELLRGYTRVAHILDALGRPKDAQVAWREVLLVLHQLQSQAKAQPQVFLSGRERREPRPRPGKENEGAGSIVALQIRFNSSSSGLRLLRLASVQKDLQLSDQQVQRIAELDAQRNVTGATTAGNWTEKTEKEVERWLRQDQKQRLQQLLLQQQGVLAFQNETVAAALHLTPDQRRRIAAVLQQEDGEIHKAPRPLERVRSLLTTKQESQWHRLVGEPFVGKLPPGDWVLCLEKESPVNVGPMMEDLLSQVVRALASGLPNAEGHSDVNRRRP